MKTLVITSGGFDPLHAGHISAFDKMEKVGNLVVIINSDSWLRRKKEKVLMSISSRELIIDSLKQVWSYWTQADVDEHNDVCHILKDILEECKTGFWAKEKYTRFVFAKSGDRTHENSPEYEWCMANGVEWLEVESDYPELHSSKILEEWQDQKVERSWGHYLTTVPYQVGDLKFKPKVLVVDPGKSLSLQAHGRRREVWYVVSGTGVSNGDRRHILLPGHHLTIYQHQKHRIENDDKVPLIICEWQIGSETSEEDIVRYPVI